mmetsp:Transcript_9297/g.20165  ORF Transcript_9297/g.20165 Transcript_9297/m.20165 type:complete len:388 (+) Transcript_9297:64-1227(+)
MSADRISFLNCERRAWSGGTSTSVAKFLHEGAPSRPFHRARQMAVISRNSWRARRKARTTPSWRQARVLPHGQHCLEGMVLPHDQCCCCCTGTGCSLTGIASTSSAQGRRRGVLSGVQASSRPSSARRPPGAATGRTPTSSTRARGRWRWSRWRITPGPASGGPRGARRRLSEPNQSRTSWWLGARRPPAGATAPPGVPGSAFGFMNAAGPTSPPKAPATPASPSPKSFDPLLRMGMPGSDDDAAADANVVPAVSSPNPNASHQMAQMAQMQLAYQQNMMMMQQQMAQMQMYQRRGSVVGSMGMQRQGSIGAGGGGGGGMGGGGGAVPPPLPVPGKQPIMGANYMRQVPVVSGGDGSRSSFSFLGDPSKKQDNHSFDFVKDAMKNEK